MQNRLQYETTMPSVKLQVPSAAASRRLACATPTSPPPAKSKKKIVN